MELNIGSTEFVIAFLAGLIPALFWLWFWLREDRQRPEPLLLIAITFIAGMAAVAAVLPMQQLACDVLQNGICIPPSDNLLYLWVVIEEVMKYAAALIVIFWNRAVDEPIDMIIYMIAIALGFAALENTFYMLNPLLAGDYLTTTLTGSFRFLGATLLHVLASASVGVFLAFAFYKSKNTKLLYGMIGLFIAIILHVLFNSFIMNSTGESSNAILGVFLFVWMGIIILFLLFEKVKLAEAQHYAHQQRSVS